MVHRFGDKIVGNSIRIEPNDKNIQFNFIEL